MAQCSQFDRNSCNQVSGLWKMNLLITYFREEVDNFFSSMDRDFDGRLSFAEMMGEETPVQTLFKKMDKNGDGFVSKKVS
jgi:Ca2+-binding EF-hand superfamily protein